MTPRKKAKKKTVKRVKRKKRKVRALKPRTYYTLNKECEFFNELKTLLLKITPQEFEKLATKVSGLGGIKLAVASGMFIDRKGSPADLLIVAKRINQTKLTTFMRGLGVEMGKELNYSLMTEDEFRYRKGMFDKFLRIMLESPHIKLINKLGYLGKS